MSIYSNPASSAAADTEAYVSALLELLGEKDPVDVLRGTPRRFGACSKRHRPASSRNPSCCATNEM